MQTHFQTDPATVEVELDSREALVAFLDTAKEQSVFLLELSPAPALHDQVHCRLSWPDGDAIELEARVVQLFPAGAAQQVVFQIDAFDEVLERRIQLLTAGDDADEADESEMTGVSPAVRIRQMNPVERSRLAFSANRVERHILRRDHTAQVLLNLLSNPRVDSEDVLQIVKSTHANAAILERIAADRRWGSNMEIRTAIVRNPKTSTPTAIRLLESLRTEDLRQLSKIGAHHETVRQAALRVYLKRSSR